MDIANGKIFAIKRLNLFRSDNEYNQECINSLKAEVEVLKNHTHEHIINYIGSEIIDNQF